MFADLRWRHELITGQCQVRGLVRVSVLSVTSIAAVTLAMFHFVFAAYLLGTTSLAEQRFLGGIDNYAEEVGRPVASVIAALIIAGLGLVLLAAGLARPIAPVIANAATIAVAAVGLLFFWLGAWPVALVAVVGSSVDLAIRSPELDSAAMTRRWSRPAVTVCAALLWVGCASTDATAPSDPSAAIATTDDGGVDDAPAGVVFTMDDHIGWLIGVLDAGQFDPAEASERFDAAFLAQVPVAALNAPLGQIAPPGSAPWRVLGDHREDRVAEITVESANGTQLTITLALASTKPHQIESLLLQPADTDQPEGYTFTQLDADLAAFAPRAALGIYDVTQGSCDVIHEHNGDQPLAIGSIFKLWVLAELANQIQQGAAAWDEPLAVRADLRSNPAGQVYQLDDGDTLTLREYAEAMISISDNTATDHLIDRLGREAIETAVARAGVAQPALNQPFLATRELFWLKYLANPPNPPDWYAADTEGRRAILADLNGKTVPWVARPHPRDGAQLRRPPPGPAPQPRHRMAGLAPRPLPDTRPPRRVGVDVRPRTRRRHLVDQPRRAARHQHLDRSPVQGRIRTRRLRRSHGGSSATTADSSSSRASSTTPSTAFNELAAADLINNAIELI